jgi:hypothetical protein
MKSATTRSIRNCIHIYRSILNNGVGNRSVIPHIMYSRNIFISGFPSSSVTLKSGVGKIHNLNTCHSFEIIPKNIPILQYNFFSSNKKIKRVKRKKVRLNINEKNNNDFVDNLNENINATVANSVEQKDSKKKVGKWQELKGYVKEYGWVFLAYWTGAWVGSGFICYGAVEATGLDGIALLKRLGSDNIYDLSGWDPRFINALIAIEINELLEFFRFPLIIATTPKVARWWRSRGN